MSSYVIFCSQVKSAHFDFEEHKTVHAIIYSQMLSYVDSKYFHRGIFQVELNFCYFSMNGIGWTYLCG